jgi:dTDP-4-dehydrorhamnose reductase
MKLKQILLLFSLVLLTGIVHAQTVYHTPKGKKYHAAGCWHLHNKGKKCSLAEALNKRLEPCSVCSPPTEIENKKENRSPSKQPAPEQKVKQVNRQSYVPHAYPNTTIHL